MHETSFEGAPTDRIHILTLLSPGSCTQDGSGPAALRSARQEETYEPDTPKGGERGLIDAREGRMQQLGKRRTSKHISPTGSLPVSKCIFSKNMRPRKVVRKSTGRPAGVPEGRGDSAAFCMREYGTAVCAVDSRRCTQASKRHQRSSMNVVAKGPTVSGQCRMHAQRWCAVIRKYRTY